MPRTNSGLATRLALDCGFEFDDKHSYRSKAEETYGGEAMLVGAYRFFDGTTCRLYYMKTAGRREATGRMVIVVGNETPATCYDTQGRYMMVSDSPEAKSARVVYSHWANTVLRSRIADIADAIAPRVTQENRSADNASTIAEDF